LADSLPLVLLVAGGLAGVPAFFVEGKTSAIFLLPVGLGFMLSGFLVAIDYRGAIALFMRGWFGPKIPLVQGRRQMRVIGAGMCVIGTGLTIFGCVAVMDAFGIIEHEIEG
jgi:hypothetical protein